MSCAGVRRQQPLQQSARFRRQSQPVFDRAHRAHTTQALVAHGQSFAQFGQIVQRAHVSWQPQNRHRRCPDRFPPLQRAIRPATLALWQRWRFHAGRRRVQQLPLRLWTAPAKLPWWFGLWWHQIGHQSRCRRVTMRPLYQWCGGLTCWAKNAASSAALNESVSSLVRIQPPFATKFPGGVGCAARGSPCLGTGRRSWRAFACAAAESLQVGFGGCQSVGHDSPACVAVGQFPQHGRVVFGALSLSRLVTP